MDPQKIAACVQCYYARMPSKGKPQSHEYTILAGVVSHSRSTGALACLSAATGTKCVPGDGMCSEGYVINDSHAEILARRAFLRYVALEIAGHLRKGPSSSQSGILTPCPHSPNTFALHPDVTLHLYISDSPCGEAHGYSDGDGGEEGGRRRTGAKVVSPGEAPLRTKSGRSDLPQHRLTQCMCCSDKVARWCGIGLQSSLLSGFLSGPLPLASVTVSGEGATLGVQGEALRRALLTRASFSHGAAAAVFSALKSLAPLPVLATHVVVAPFEKSLAASVAAATSSGVGEGNGAGGGVKGGGAGGKKRPRSDNPSEEESRGESGAAATAAPLPPLSGGTGSGSLIVPSPLSLIAHALPLEGTSAAASIAATSAPALIFHHEALLGSTGKLMGSNKGTGKEKAASSLCKAKLATLVLETYALCNSKGGEGESASANASAVPLSYSQAKQHFASDWHKQAKAAWHGAAEGGALFSHWLYVDREKWEGFKVA